MKTSLIRTIFAGGLAAPAAALANGGDTFLTATALPAGPLNFTDSGTTLGFANDVSTLLANVNGNYTQVAGPDVFYRIDIVTGGTITFTLDPTGASWDPSIYITNSLLATNNPGAGPGSGADDGGSNFTESFTFNLTPGTYYLAIDSFYSTGALSAGTFDLTVAGTAVVGIPEPSTFALLAVGAVAGGGALWRRRRAGAAR